MKKILTIDDDRDFCFFLKKNLEKAGGFEVSICNESLNAVSEVRRIKPDLILLDIMMPDKSGIDVATELRANKDTKRIPVIFFTAIIKEDELKKQKNILGEGIYVSKVIETENLVPIIKDALKASLKSAPQAKEKTRIVTFLTREQIDFLDKMGKDVMFLRGVKLSRTEALSELVNFLMELGIDIKDIDVKEGLAKGILKKLGR